MLEQELTTLAAAGGAAIVTAASTDAWTRFRDALARWFGRGNPQREQAQRERLDQTAAALQAADGGVQARARQEASWQTRIELLLESLDEADRAQAVNDLGALLEQQKAPHSGISAGDGVVAAGGDLNITADNGSMALGAANGPVTFTPPPAPAPPQG
ncbi:hypothetical protein CCS38_34095 [Streptomyces purpurogeneiscleroticus]|nr:hypothetical protein [Streptomyces purpurogeneiscleroticus]